MKKENIKSPFIFVRLAEWNILRHLLANGTAWGDDLLQLPHSVYCNRPNIILQLLKKGLIAAENKTKYTPEETLLRSIFKEGGEKYLLTPAGKALIKDGMRLVRKYKKMGVDITDIHLEPDESSESGEEEKI